MKKIIWVFLVCVGLIFIGTACPGKNPVDTESVQEKREPAAPTFQIEDVDGVPHIHNVSSVWKGAPSLSLEFVRRIGELNGDENHSFFKPSGIDFDFEGNLYVVDSGNVRIQKFSPDGEFLQSLGRKGQGPGEFQLMGGISLNERNEMHITDLNTSDIKVLSPSGEAIRKIHVEYISNQLECVPNGFVFARRLSSVAEASRGIVRMLEEDGSLSRAFGPEDLREEWDDYRYFNRVYLAADEQDGIFVAYGTKNRIEKYDREGNLVLVMDRPLNYDLSEKVTYTERMVGRRKMKLPDINMVSAGLDVDSEGRIWVLSHERQLTFEERPLTVVFFDAKGNQEASQNIKTSGSTEVDAFAFHVFNREGHYLGKLPISHFAGQVKIHKNRLAILERQNDVSVFEYRIMDTDR